MSNLANPVTEMEYVQIGNWDDTSWLLVMLSLAITLFELYKVCPVYTPWLLTSYENKLMKFLIYLMKFKVLYLLRKRMNERRKKERW